jgi:hypothetical protein
MVVVGENGGCLALMGCFPTELAGNRTFVR